MLTLLQRSRRWSHTSSLTPIQAFFARYPKFSYDLRKGTMAQFHDMAGQLGWGKRIRCKALSEIQVALVRQFNEMYGGDANDLRSWKKLCEVVSRREIVPNDIDACKEVIKSVHVNIYDLVDWHPANKVPLPIHDTETALSKYTLHSDYKIFPRGIAVGHEITRAKTSVATLTPIQAFFAQYPEFSYDPSGETMKQFWDMIRQFGWVRDEDRKDEALSGIRDAIAQQFTDIYGGNAGDLGAWQRLWEIVGEGEMPTDIKACRAAIKRVFVNICDLVDFPATKVPPPLFANAVELSEYSRSNRKIYPKENAYAGGLLQFLLRKIFHPPQIRGRGSGRGGRRGLQHVITTRPPTPIEAFFARYPEYPYDQSRETMSQFREMSSQFGWGKRVKRDSLDALHDAIAQQFNDIYGANVNDLQAWQRLCGLVGGGNIPDNIEACRAVIRRVHVNICDLVDYPATTIPPPVFFTESALARYSLESDKIFPKENAYSGGLLKFLLRHIFHLSSNRGIGSDNGRASGSG
ncbi:hypothetical protein F5146DRAFT_927646 [Armillaria mellea]|nr:hypothetical protein F5146DRAFT_927646 [Armillaria mellea]